MVKPEEVAAVTKGGIILPDESRQRDQYAAMRGTLVAASPLAFTYENWPEGSRKPQVGDRVLYAKFAGCRETGADDVEYRVMNDKDIFAVLA